MISILEYVTPNRGYVRDINPKKMKVGKINIRRASLSKAFPSIPSKSGMMGVNLDQLRKNQNVSPVTGTKFPATAYKMMGRKAPTGTGFANVPLRRI